MPFFMTVDSSFEEIVLYILAWTILLICIGCIYAFFRAIVLFVFSNGKPEKIQAAWSSIRYMILWMFFTILFLFAAPTLLKLMHVRWAEQYTAKNVFSYMWKIITKISWLWNIFVKSQQANQMNGLPYYNI
jgi:hypothetical protein